MDVASYT